MGVRLKILEIIILIYAILLSFFDLREKKVPAAAVLAGAVATLAYTAIFLICAESAQEAFMRILLGAVPGILLSVIAITTKKAGIADGIVLSLLGMLTDYRRGIRIFCFSIIIMAVFSMIMLAFRKIKTNSELPYLPFLTTALFADLVWKF